MFRRIFGDIPDWATQQNPVLRYEVIRHEPKMTARARILRISGWVLLLTSVIFGGYLAATNLMQEPAGLNITESLWRVLFFPVLIAQLILRIAGVSLGVSAISTARQRQMWDDIRVTANGAALFLRTRVMAILFYRLRSLVVIILTARLVLFGAILFELLTWQGRYLAFIARRGDPMLPLVIAVMVLAALIVANFILPLTATALDIALGLFISARVRSRAVASMLQLFIILVRVGLVVVFYLAMQQWILQPDSPVINETLALLLVGAYSAFADLGLLMMQLSEAAGIWAVIPYSIFIGVGLLVFALGQFALVKGILHLARQAATQDM